MRKPRQPKYCRHKATDLARVKINGKDQYLGKYNSPESFAMYDSIIAQWLRAGRNIDHVGITIRKLCGDYGVHSREYYSKRDETTSTCVIIDRICRILIEKHGKELAEDFAPRKLIAIREELVARGLARTTINATTRHLVGIFRWGVAEGMLPPATWQALMAVRPLQRGRTKAHDNPGRKPVPLAIVLATLDHCSPRVATLIRLQLFTGMRSGEILAMRPMDIDRSGEIWIYTPKIHKMEHKGIVRTVGLGLAAQAVIEPWLNVADDCLMFQSAWKRKRKTAYKVSVIRRRVNNYQRDIKDACLKTWPCPGIKYQSPRLWSDEDRAKISEHLRKVGWCPHQLRHTAATYLRSQLDIEAARVALGHSEVGTTERYAATDVIGIVQRSTLALETIMDSVRGLQAKSIAGSSSNPSS